MKRAHPKDITDLCDVCGREDGFQRMNMQKCQNCGVCVHDICYGLTNNAIEERKYSQWKCAPCSAIGLSLKVSKPSESYRSISISSRTTECVLCSVNTGLHAMHLLYNTHGKDGTPVILLPNKRKGLEERVAWVHTLCALFIGDRKKIIFGCKKDGTCLGESDDEEDDDDDNEQYDENDEERNVSNSELEQKNEMSLFDSRGKGLIALNNPHHFVVAHTGEDGVEDDWSRAVRVIKEARYKCFICGLGNGLKQKAIAIPCRHKGCTQCFHVGCARWGKSSKRYERITFNPGAFNDSVEDYDHPTALGYCDMHSNKKKYTSTVMKDQLHKFSKNDLQGGVCFRNDKRHKKGQSTKCNKTSCDSKNAICIYGSLSKENELQINYDGGVVITDEDCGDKQSSEKWSYLWVPNYRPDSGYLSHWDSKKEIHQQDIDGW